MPSTTLSAALRKSLAAVAANQHLNAFVSVRPEPHLVSEVQAAETRATPKSVLDGRLIAVKDNICTLDAPTTCASSLLDCYTSPFEATVVTRLREAGAVILGKTNMDEFGMGSHSLYSSHGAVRNPRDPSVSAGGSSGGSAAAVAAGVCEYALGTDTGGSVRLPAAYCGVVGFKPSYGLVSRWGVVAYANSLDTVGILGRNWRGCRDVFNIISAHDPLDPSSTPPSVRRRLQTPTLPNRPLRIGVPLEYNLTELTRSVRDAWTQTLDTLSRRGHRILPISLPHTPQALSAYYILAPAEASSNLSRYDGLRYGSLSSSGAFTPTRSSLGAEVQRRILLGAFTLSAGRMDNFFRQAQKVRRLVRQDFERVLEGEVDALVAPAALGPPPRLADVGGMGDFVNDVLTVPASLAGVPSLCLPCGEAGMQVMSRWGGEEVVWRVAEELDK